MGLSLFAVAVGWTHSKAQEKLSLCIPQGCTQETEVHLEPFLTSALDRSKRPTSYPSYFNPRYWLNRGLDGPRECLDVLENRKISWLWITPQHNHYTDCTIPNALDTVRYLCSSFTTAGNRNTPCQEWSNCKRSQICVKQRGDGHWDCGSSSYPLPCRTRVMVPQVQ